MTRKTVEFIEAVEAARSAHGWTVEEIAEKLAVSIHAVQSWIKPDSSGSSRRAPVWATLALTALTQGRPVTERRGALEVTYAPATTRRRAH